MKIDNYATFLGALASLAAAVFWIWSSMVDVPDNIDTIIAALQLASKLSGYAALAAAVAAICGLFLCIRRWGESAWVE